MVTVTIPQTRPVDLLRAVRAVHKGTSGEVAAEIYGTEAALGSWVSNQLHALARRGLITKERIMGRGPWEFSLSDEGDRHLTELEEKAKR